jgi:hypothetical protein
MFVFYLVAGLSEKRYTHDIPIINLSNTITAFEKLTGAIDDTFINILIEKFERLGNSFIGRSNDEILQIQVEQRVNEIIHFFNNNYGYYVIDICGLEMDNDNLNININNVWYRKEDLLYIKNHFCDLKNNGCVDKYCREVKLPNYDSVTFILDGCGNWNINFS